MNTTPKPADDGAMILAGALLFALVWRSGHKISLAQRRRLVWMLGLTVVGLIILTVAALLLYKHKLQASQLRPTDWHKMSGLQFEDQVVIWLKVQGYDPVVKTEYFDQGIDIVAAKSGVNYGIQVKRSSRPVGVAAVRAAVAGLNTYRCDQAMVVTNSGFTAQAQTLARANSCHLVDGNELKSGYSQLKTIASTKRE